MAEYPALPPFSGTVEQSNLPYLPPFQNQLIQFNNNPYAINHASLYGSSGLNPGGSQIPMYQGLSQDLTSLPQYTNSLHDPTYHANNKCEQQVNPQICENLGQLYNTNLQASVPFKQPNNAIPNNHKPASEVPKTTNPYSSSIAGVKTSSHPQNNHAILYSKKDASKPQLVHNPGLNPISEQAAASESQRQRSSSYSPEIFLAAPEKSPLIRSPPKSSTKDEQDSRIKTRHNIQHLPKKPLAIENHDYCRLAVPTSVPTPVYPATNKTIRKTKTSLSEIKNKAQNAILNLSSHGVQYNTFIREGFKADVIDKLFEELDIIRSSDDRTGIPESEQMPESLTSQTIHPNHEESNTTQSSNNHPLPNPSERNLSLAPKKPSQMDEKQKTLQSKMEALRKSREARATAKTSTKIDQEQIPVEQQQPEPTSTTVETKPNNQPSPIASPKPCLASKSPEKVLSNTESHPQGPSIPISEPTGKKIRSQEVKKISSELTIPGLFLASNRTSLSTTPPLRSPVIQRKRPVASDFDDSHTIGAFKRPFGHNRNEQRFVIDVSDDESEDGDVPMDIESQVDQLSPVWVSDKVNNAASNVGLPTISQKPFTPPPNSSGHTLSAISNAPLSTPSILLQKQREIQLMKKRIAEAEAQLKAKSTPACPGSPQRSESVTSDAKNTPSPAISSSNKNESAKTTCEISEDLSSNVTKPLNRPGSEEDNVSKPIQNNIKDKRLRRQIIVANIPLVEAEVEKRQSKLEQLRAEMNIIEAGLKEHLDEKKRLAEEMDRLGHDSDDVPQVQSEIIGLEVNDADHQIDESPTALESEQHMTSSLTPISPQNDIPKISGEEPRFIVTAAYSSNDSLHGESNESNHEVVQASETEIDQRSLEKNQSIVCASPETEIDLRSTEKKQSIGCASPGTVHSEVNSKKEPIKLTNDDHATSDASKPDLEIKDLPSETKILSQDYVPQSSTNEVLEGESDNYEPPEAAATAAKSLRSSPISPASPGFIHESKNDSELNIDTKQVLDESKQASLTQAQFEENASSLQKLVHEPSTRFQSTKPFTPYKSPLRIFRAYRFHPNYKKDIAGGLRSVTYSHKIDPNKEFCRFEVAGGVCNDTTCDLQHFKSIILPDDGVMAALGSPDEFKGDRREQFVAGLREVLVGLRLRQVKDFDMIASEIVAHRAKFLGDSSKILALEGITV